MKFGKLKRVDLRTGWNHEAHDFTRWLALESNIALLADEVGIDMEVIETEARVGRFNVDILAQEETSSRKVIIENQLEITDHSHLGQLITYAAGLEAEFIIWIVRDVREEHREAVDWLNEHTDDEINFFLVEIQLWQIGDSPPAAKFAVISRPNEWKRSVRSTTHDAPLTDTKAKQFEFWQQLKDYAEGTSTSLRFRTPRPQHWYDVAIGRSDCHVSLTVDSRQDKVCCLLYIHDSKDLFRSFLAHRDEIEAEISIDEELDWKELPKRKASIVKVISEYKFSDESEWSKAFAWLVDTAAKFKGSFGKNW